MKRREFLAGTGLLAGVTCAPSLSAADEAKAGEWRCFTRPGSQSLVRDIAAASLSVQIADPLEVGHGMDENRVRGKPV